MTLVVSFTLLILLFRQGIRVNSKSSSAQNSDALPLLNRTLHSGHCTIVADLPPVKPVSDT